MEATEPIRMKIDWGSIGAGAASLAIFVGWPLYTLLYLDAPSTDPCRIAADLRLVVKQDRLDLAREAIQRKKDRLDDELDKVEMSPEAYQDLHKKLQNLDRQLAEYEAKHPDQDPLTLDTKRLAEMEAKCQAQQRKPD
jgi:hypothetical protein